MAWQLQRTGALARWPERLRTALTRAAVASGVVTELWGSALTQVLAALASAGIRPLLIKGAGLAHTRYPHPYLRPRVDTDLLVRREDAPRAGLVLEGLGYRRLEFISGELISYQCPYARGDRHGVQHVFDIHWKIANPQRFANLLTFDALEAEAVPVPALGEHARAVDGVPALVLACVHRIAHHRDAVNLLWLQDIHLLAVGMDERAARGLAALAVDPRVKAVCARGLALARQWFHTPLPEGLLEALDVPSGSASDAHAGRRLWRLGGLWSDLKALPDWRKRWRLLREHVLPPASYVRARYGHANPLLLPMLYVHRVARGAYRWLQPEAADAHSR